MEHISTHLKKLAFEKYLSGEESEGIDALDYTNTALNLTDYVQNYYIHSRNGTNTYYEPFEYKFNSIHDSFNGFWLGKFFRCFDIVVPSKDDAEISILINNTIHHQGNRPMVWDFFVMFHYPNQVLRSSLFNNYMWPTTRALNDSTYEMVFRVETVEIFRRRKSCNPNYNTYDDQIMDYFVKKIACSPPYWNERYLKKNSEIKTCNTSDELKEFATSIYLGKDHGFDPPCKSLEFMTFKYNEIEYKGTPFDSGGNFGASFIVPNLIFKVKLKFFL